MTQQNGTNGSKCAEEYVVKRGDSFYLIAHKLGVPLRDLLAANRDIHPARLMVGDVLCIPREEDDSPESGGLGGGTANGNGTNGNGTNGGVTNGNGNGATNGGTNGGTTNGNGTNGGINGGTANGNGTNGGTNGGATNGTNGGSNGNGTNGGVTNGNGTNGGTTNGNGSTNGNGNGTTNGISPDPTLPCPEDDQWIVQRGQTVADLQLRNLVSRHTLETANPGVDLDALRVGQTLCIPKENVPCEIPETYTLEQTETLEAVAVRFNLPVASLLRVNPCLAPQDFEEGVTVILPR